MRGGRFTKHISYIHHSRRGLPVRFLTQVDVYGFQGELRYVFVNFCRPSIIHVLGDARHRQTQLFQASNFPKHSPTFYSYYSYSYAHFLCINVDNITNSKQNGCEGVASPGRHPISSPSSNSPSSYSAKTKPVFQSTTKNVFVRREESSVVRTVYPSNPHRAPTQG